MTTDPLMSAILDDLAGGRIDASEAARRIDALKAASAEDRSEPVTVGSEPATPPEDVPAAAPTASEPRGKAANGVERISVRAVGRRVRIVGETSVATLSADGPHVLRRNGSVLEGSRDGELGAS